MFNKIVVAELPPFLLAGIRFVIAGGLIFLFVGLSGKLKKVTKAQLINSAFAGILFLSIGNGCAVWALQYVDSGFEALVISTQPLVLIIMLFFIEKKQIMIKSIIGILLGVIGIYLLVDQGGSGFSTDKWKGILAIVVALISWGYGSIFVGKSDLPSGHFVNTAYQMLFGGIVMLLISFLLSEPRTALSILSTKAIYSMSFLVVFGSVIAFTSYNYLLTHVSPEKVATSTYVNPIVALFLGWVVLGESITSRSILAAFVLLIGVYFINTSNTRAIRSKAQ